MKIKNNIKKRACLLRNIGFWENRILSWKIFFIGAVFLGCFWGVSSASAATVTWDGGGTTNNWSEGANWSGNVVPTIADDVVFDATSGKDATWDASGPANIKSLTVNNTYSGAFSMGRNVTTSYGWVFEAASFNAGTYRLTIGGFSTSAYFTPGSVNYYDVEFAAGTSAAMAITGTAYIENDLIITSIAYVSGNMEVKGDLTVLVADGRSTGVITMNGTGDQTITGTAGGRLVSVVIDKPSGVLHLVGTIQPTVNWTWTRGTLDAGTSTLEFVTNPAFANSTFTPGDGKYYNIIVNRGNYDLTISGTARVSNELKLSSEGTEGVSAIWEGIIEVEGDLTMQSTSFGGKSTLIRMIGYRDQKISSNGGEFPSLEIEKTGGTLTVEDDIILQEDWNYISGNVDFGFNTLRFDTNGGSPAHSNFNPGKIKYYNINVNKGNYDLVLQGDLFITNELRVASANEFFLGSYTVNTKDFIQTSGYINLQTGVLKLTGNFTKSGGTFTAGNSIVAFQGTNQTIDVTGSPTTFYRLYKLTNEADTLTITAGNNITIANGGIMRLWGKPEGKTLSLRSSVPGSAYTITRTGSVEAEYCDFQDANFSSAVTAAASNDTSGNTNLTVTKEFISTIRASGGDYSTLSAWEAAFGTIDLTSAATKVFSHGGIVGTLPDNSAVSGETSLATATLVHVTDSQILLKSISGIFQAGEKVWLDSDHNNYVIISDAGYGAIVTAHPYNDWPSGLDDALWINGFTAGVNNYVKIYVPVSQRHDGKINGNGFYMKSSSNAEYMNNIDGYASYTVIDGIKIIRTATNWSYGATIALGTSTNGEKREIEIKNCLLYYQGGGENDGSLIAIGGANLEGYGHQIHNNILISDSDVLDYGIKYVRAYDNAEHKITKIYNNLVYGKFVKGGIYINTDSSTDAYKAYVKNNYVANIGTGNDYSFLNQYNNALVNFSRNFSDDGSAGTVNGNGTISLADALLVDTATASEDVHLKDKSLLKDAGVDLSTDSVWPIVSDIDGDSRLALEPNAWDIGADEYYPTIAAQMGGSEDSSADPVAYYNFNEGYGSVAHNEGSYSSSSYGTLYAGSAGRNATNTAMWDKNGKKGSGIDFDGSDRVGLTMSDVYYSSNYSISSWFKTGELATNQVIYHGRENVNDERAVQILVNSNGTVSFFERNLYPNGYLTVSSTNRYDDNEWHQIIAIKSGTTYTLYIDGKYINQGTLASNSLVLDYHNLGVYRQDDGVYNYYFNGLIDDFKMYNYALSAEQVKKEYNGGAIVQMGSSGTTSTGAPTNADSRDYCVPGDTATCNPPVGEWNFNEKVKGDAKTLSDTSGNGNNGTTVDGANNTGMDCSVPGKVGTGCRFDGVDDYVTATTNDSLTGGITVTGWIKPITGTTIIAKGKTTETGFWRVDFQFDNRLYFIKDGGTDLNARTIPQFTLNEWQFFSMTWNGGATASTDVKFYRNGKLVSHDLDINGVSLLSESGLDYYIGAQGQPQAFFNGQIDQVRIYDYARTPAQIAWEYNQGRPIAEWRMNECQGTTIHDESGNGNTGTLTLGASGQTVAGTCSASASTPWYAGRTGKYGASLNFDGGDDYVTLGDPALLQLTGSMTISAWINASRLGGEGIVTTEAIVNKLGYPPKRSYNMLLQNDGKIIGQVARDGSNTAARYSNSSLITGQWYHVLYSYNATAQTLDVYINGKLDNGSLAGTVPTSQYTNNGEPVIIGGRNDDPPQNFSGQIDEVKIFNYALTAEQVRNLYNNSSAVQFNE
jgi:hypothetical protein